MRHFPPLVSLLFWEVENDRPSLIFLRRFLVTGMHSAVERAYAMQDMEHLHDLLKEYTHTCQSSIWQA